ncbi:SAF domain-containing protein [Alkaliphilus serpentinus]|uniref:SAF domain-containing protein n=1 Tax=Alkaliphilus serpentinus TaxID=1482731 RepID=A0A833HL68_9FIRM|nr:SAF domain-containing protein [Alkaliphilus serpentinus]KAB3525454.1 hypothetical protein F8153_15320 [Alkaliphilus serpentinus]
MAFGKKRNRLKRLIMMIVPIILLLSGAVVGGMYLYDQQIDEIRNQYESEINDLQMEIYQSKRIAYVPKEEIKAGTRLSLELLEEIEILSSVPQGRFITEEDLGKIAKVDLQINTPIYKSMTLVEDISDDLREEEFNMILLQSNMAKDKYIDVRITFPNGENYIVLSKKKIRDVALDKNTIWLWLKEEEILKFSSAIVDAYIHHGTKLYTVTYVEPGLQKEAIANYTPNINVLNIIASNPNIVEEAKAELHQQLTRDLRNGLDERLALLKSEDIMMVNSGIKDETNRRNDKISEDFSEDIQEDELKSESEDNQKEGDFFD